MAPAVPPSVPAQVLPLPGFMPGAVAFAFRTTMASLLAYWVAFELQLDTAVSAGVCVAVVVQPTRGMALNKALYRVLGTLAGGAVALLFMSSFPQDRTAMLAAFVLWMGLCSYVATLLRDFRAYGVALAGYTAAIIAITGIDQPDGAFLAALNRMAAILIGIVSVAVVNSVFAADTARLHLVNELKRHLEELRCIAQDVLRGRRQLDNAACVRQASDITTAPDQFGQLRRWHDVRLP